MLEKFSKIDNPLTVIAIFAGITEVASSFALPFLNHDIQQTFIWFLILFPLGLVVAFFLTLNLNAKALYAPADYRDDKHFLQALSISEKTPQINVKDPGIPTPSIETLKTASLPNNGKSPFDGISKKELDTINSAIQAFGKKIQILFEKGLVDSFSIAVCGEGIFLLTIQLKDLGRPTSSVARIIRSKTNGDEIVLRAVGKNVSSSNPDKFAELLLQNINAEIEQISKYNSQKKESKDTTDQGKSSD